MTIIIFSVVAVILMIVQELRVRKYKSSWEFADGQCQYWCKAYRRIYNNNLPRDEKGRFKKK